MTEHKYSHTCYCEKCGNESEMVVTCELEADQAPSEPDAKDTKTPAKKKVLGHAVCNSCGNEADMWVDLPEQP